MSYASPEMAGERPGKPREKSNFAQTCRLLSQFLKERRRLAGDPGLRMTLRTEDTGQGEASIPPLETKNLLGSMEDIPGPDCGASKVKRSDFLANSADFSAFSGSGEINASAKDSENFGVGGEGPVAGSAPAVMTIFYGGRVFVFDDFPAGQLKAIAGLVLAADSGGSETQETMISSDESPGTVPAATGKGILHAPSDLPLATNASLHRFFEKRRDRASPCAAPYQVNPRSSQSPCRIENAVNPAVLDLQADESSGHLELRL